MSVEASYDQRIYCSMLGTVAQTMGRCLSAVWVIIVSTALSVNIFTSIHDSRIFYFLFRSLISLIYRFLLI